MNPGPIAVLSDIHGNVRALDAVLADIAQRGIEQVLNLGDGLYGPFDPVPVADRLLEANWPTVSGNEDRILLAVERQQVSRTARFTRDRLNHEHLDWLAHLPKTVALDDRTLAFHAAPVDDAHYLLSRPTGGGTMRPATDDEIAEKLGPVGARLILCGHDHLPRVVRLDDGRTIVNPGSVGCPAYTDDHPIPHRVENGSPHARYAVIEWVDESPQAELLAIPYDWTAATAEAAANGFPDWAYWLRTGRAT